MSTQNDDKDVKGRSWDQLTGGTTSAATMGAGATGDVGAKAEDKDPARSRQSAQQGQGSSMGQAGRTDDLLAGGSSEEQGDQGFQGKTAGKPGQAAPEAIRRDNK